MITETRHTLTNRHMHILESIGDRELPGGVFGFVYAELQALVRWGFVEARPSTLKKRRSLYRLTDEGKAMLAAEGS